MAYTYQQLGTDAAPGNNTLLRGNGDGSLSVCKGAIGSEVELMKIAADGSVTFTGALAATTALAGPSGSAFGFRNLLINGCCRVAQRGSVPISTSNWAYGGADRIQFLPSLFTTATGNIQQISGASTKSGFMQGSVLTTTGTGQVGWLQKIEAKNTAHLAGKTVTFSATLYHNTGAPLSGYISIQKAGAADDFSSPVQIGNVPFSNAASGAYTPISASFNIGAADAANGLMVVVMLQGVGAVTSKMFGLGDLQLELGAVATPFEMRPYGQELALCQRYYEKSYSLGTAPGSIQENGFRTFINTSSAGATTGDFQFKVPKRTTPSTVNIYSPVSGAAAKVRNEVAGTDEAATLGTVNENGLGRVSGSTTTSATSFRFHFTADAEL